MRLPALLTSDLHLVADPSCDYRWGLFPWLRTTAKEEGAKTVCVLGDLVDRKDNHPAVLVNRVADELARLRAETGAEVIVMAGNHDWLKEGEVFFRFLRHIPGVTYVSEPWEHPDVKGRLAMFLPFARDPAAAWRDLTSLEHYDLVFMHQTVRGSVASNGDRLDGEALPDIFRGAGKIWSGDIHVPQVVGQVEYVGSPYHVHFGDDFVPRVVLLDRDARAIDLHVPGMPRRVTIRASSFRQLMSREVREGDQVKLRLELRPEELHGWQALRRQCVDWLRSRGAVVHGAELVAVGGDGRRMTPGRALRLARLPPDEAVLRYVRDEELGGDAYEEGMRLL